MAIGENHRLEPRCEADKSCCSSMMEHAASSVRQESWSALCGWPFLPAAGCLALFLRYQRAGPHRALFRTVILGNKLHQYARAVVWAMAIRGLIRLLRSQLVGSLSKVHTAAAAAAAPGSAAGFR